jgi:benzoate/toluate 1,2-dioxygenase beta subunit
MNSRAIDLPVAEAARIGLQEASQLLFQEARLLDTGRFDAWLDLYADDAVYWVPTSAAQTDPLNVPSIMYENKDLLSMRVSRLMHPRTYVTHPQPRTTHAVSNIAVIALGDDADTCRVASVILVHEYCAEQRRLFSGQCEHVLRRQDDRLEIVSKRVDLVDVGSTYSAFLIPF